MLASLILLPVGGLPPLGQLPPMRNITAWVASHVFGITRPLIITGRGSGDKTFDWVQAFCFVVIATLTILVWSFVDRARDNYVGILRRGVDDPTRYARRLFPNCVTPGVGSMAIGGQSGVWSPRRFCVLHFSCSPLSPF